MQLHDPQPLVLGDVILDWGWAEASSPMRPIAALPSIQAIVAKRAAATELRPGEEVEVATSLLLDRLGLLAFFIQHPTSWFTGTVPRAELAGIRVMGMFRDPYKVDTMGPFVTDGHARTAGLGIAAFKPGNVRGRLIVVADDIAGDWCLIEGNNRCVSFLQLADAPEIDVEVIVGVCGAARQWPGW